MSFLPTALISTVPVVVSSLLNAGVHPCAIPDPSTPASAPAVWTMAAAAQHDLSVGRPALETTSPAFAGLEMTSYGVRRRCAAVRRIGMGAAGSAGGQSASTIKACFD
jgi:hypothetical protein